MLFSAKAIYFRIPTLRRLVAIFIIFKILVDGNAADSLLNSLGLILLEEFISVDNYVGVYRGGKFYY